MSLSVIVTSYNSPRVLRKCLESLVRQPEAAEIIVADCSPSDPTVELRSHFPGVRFLHFKEKRTVPQLRWAALRETSGTIVAAIEARCVPADNWCAELLRGHRNPAPAVGGAVAIACPSAIFDWALYFCEYGRFAPPVEEGDTAELSGANVSWKREALEESRDLTAAGAWETLLHQRWLRQGYRLRLCSATITFENTMDVSTALRQRFHYGRGYAAARLCGPERILYAAFTPLLPALLTWRIARAAWQKSLADPFVRAFFWILILNAAWAGGELIGYLFGESPEPQIF